MATKVSAIEDDRTQVGSRTRPCRAVAVGIAAIVVVAACGGSSDPPSSSDDASTATESVTDSGTSSTTTSTAPAPTSPVPPSTTADPYALYTPTEPVDVDVEWRCDEPRSRGAFLITTCSTPTRDEPILNDTNWIFGLTYINDEDGNRVGISASASGYSPNCTWDPADVTPVEAPLIDGKATTDGVLIGGGRCEGVQWTYYNTWDEATKSNVTTGVIERIG